MQADPTGWRGTETESRFIEFWSDAKRNHVQSRSGLTRMIQQNCSGLWMDWKSQFMQNPWAAGQRRKDPSSWFQQLCQYSFVRPGQGAVD